MAEQNTAKMDFSENTDISTKQSFIKGILDLNDGRGQWFVGIFICLVLLCIIFSFVNKDLIVNAASIILAVIALIPFGFTLVNHMRNRKPKEKTEKPKGRFRQSLENARMRINLALAKKETFDKLVKLYGTEEEARKANPKAALDSELADNEIKNIKQEVVKSASNGIELTVAENIVNNIINQDYDDSLNIEMSEYGQDANFSIIENAIIPINSLRFNVYSSKDDSNKLYYLDTTSSVSNDFKRIYDRNKIIYTQMSRPPNAPPMSIRFQPRPSASTQQSSGLPPSTQQSSGVPQPPPLNKTQINRAFVEQTQNNLEESIKLARR